MTVKPLLPSEALGRQFDLPKEQNEDKQVALSTQPTTVTTHAFLIGSLGLLVPADGFCELADCLQLCRLPNAPAWLEGMANQRGNIVPVFDLQQLFGWEPVTEARARKFLVIGQKEESVGILIDRLPMRVSLGMEDRLARNPPLPESLQSFTRACYEKAGQVWVDWDIHGFFAAAGAPTGETP